MGEEQLAASPVFLLEPFHMKESCNVNKRLPLTERPWETKATLSYTHYILFLLNCAISDLRIFVPHNVGPDPLPCSTMG